MRNKIRAFLGGLAMFGLLISPNGNTFAAVTVPSAVTTNVSSDTAVSGSVALPTITLTEGLAGDIPMGAITFALPNGFVFDTTSIASVATTGTGLSASSTVSFTDSAHIAVNVTSTSTAAGTLAIGSTTPLKVKASSGTPMASSGNIMLSSGVLTGLASTTSFGVLTQIPGAPSKLAFTIQPPATVAVNTAFNASVAVKDQFGNLANTDSGRAITLTVSAISPTTTTGTLSGSATINNTAGVANFSGLSFNQAGTIALNASSAGLTSALSSNVVVTSTGTGTTTPPSTNCNLKNGILVKLPGSPTIYMVVNCVLKPFTTPAIFHARGKKFKDIKEIFGSFRIGKPVSENENEDEDDDDDNRGGNIIVIPPTASTSTSTLPVISGMPNGSIVRLPNDPTVYLVVNGQLQPFTSATVFRLHNKRFSDVKIITQEQFNQLQLGSAVVPPDGTLLKGSDHTVYVVRDGKLFGIPSMQVLNKHGWSLNKLETLSDGELNSLGRGGIQD